MAGRRVRRRDAGGGPNLWYRFAVLVIVPGLRLLTRRDFRGQEHVPRTGGVILAANHISEADPFVLAVFVHQAGRRPRFMAKSELFGVPFVRSVLRGTGQIPVYRKTADAGAALRDAVAALEAGHCVVIYPEGTTTKDPDGWPMAGRTGVARLAALTGVPVIPLAQWGAEQLQGPHKRRTRRPLILRRPLVRVSAGPALQLPPVAAADDAGAGAEARRGATDEVIAELTRMVAELRGEPAPADVFDPQLGARRPRATGGAATRRSA